MENNWREDFFTKQERKRKEYQEKGICPVCQGSGEIGGQFCGGMMFECDECEGSGKYDKQTNKQAESFNNKI